LIQGQTGGARKEEEPWKAGHQQQQPGLNGPQQGGSTNAHAQLQAQMLLNMVKSAGINAADANPIEHLQALFQRQAQVNTANKEQTQIYFIYHKIEFRF